LDVLVDADVDILYGEIVVSANSTKNNSSHLDVLSLEHLERAKPENLRGDNTDAGSGVGADQGRAGPLQ
jgi:hypothetical protein